MADSSRRPRTAWHPAFVQAFQLELEQYRDILEFIPEFQLTSEPLRIDLVIIRKHGDITIEKNIAAMFRGENLVEYKSPGDHISVADFYKVYGYACLYASLERAPITELTISFVGSRKPKKLLEHLREVRGFKVEERWAGIYHVEGDIMPIQVIDSRELSAGENLWLRGLSGDLEIGSAAAILKASREKVRKIPLGAYLQVILNANAGIFLEVGRMENGSLTFDDVLVELGLTARWDAKGRVEGREDGREEGRVEGLRETAKNLKTMGLPPDQIAAATGLDPELIEVL
ncbi:MAG: hypothetical protein LBL20_01900 [Treponema sp.]|jgi:hypothetical protein|nr:hypothetical protein [Treponema sp.]